MQIITIAPRGFGSNTYVLTADGKTAVVIDPSQSRAETELLRLGLKAEYVLLTHCHFDHVGGVAPLQASGARVISSDIEKPFFGTHVDLFDHFSVPRVPCTVDEVMSDNEERVLCGIRIRALVVPGHTDGSTCYLVTDEDGKRYLFSGDLLFANSVGRTDFPTGNFTKLRQSLRRVLALADDMPVYAGHNEPTCLAHERKNNPFLTDL